MKARIFAEENKKWWTLAAVAFGLFMIMLDNTIVNVALPSIQRSLHMSLSSLEWIVTAYALTFAALLITGGKLGEVFGELRDLARHLRPGERFADAVLVEADERLFVA